MLAMSYMWGFGCSLAVEAPFMQLEKVMFGRTDKAKPIIDKDGHTEVDTLQEASDANGDGPSKGGTVLEEVQLNTKQNADLANDGSKQQEPQHEINM